MPKNCNLFAVMALVSAGMLLPASAEFSGSNGQRAHALAGRYTDEFAAQSRPHIVVRPRRIHPGPNAKRQCVAWLAREYRVSGPVVVPQMRCWWE